MAKQAQGKAKSVSKSELLNRIAETTSLSRKQVGSFFDALSETIQEQLGNKKGPGVFVIPGLVKLKVIRKPAQPEREGINPFTGEKTTFKAKPARNVVKAQPLKKLKEMV